MNASLLARSLMLDLSSLLLANCGGGGGSSASSSSGVDPTPSISDSAAPQVSLTTPANLANDLTGTVALQASVNDDIAVTRVEFEGDGIAAGTDEAAPYAINVNTADYAAGQHIVGVRATCSWQAAVCQLQLGPHPDLRL